MALRLQDGRRRFSDRGRHAARQAVGAAGIMCRQIHGGTRLAKTPDRIQRGAANLLVSADAVQPALEHQFFIIGGVAGQEIRGVVVLHHNGEMIHGVIGRRDRDDVTGLRQSPARGERAE